MNQKTFAPLVLLSLIFLGGSYARALTRQDLLGGCPIPEKRDFPVSAHVAPCDNFYEYACSEVTHSFPLPADRSYWDFSFSDASERILYAKKSYFKEMAKGYTPRSPRARQLKDYYLACMNESASAQEEKRIVQSEVRLIEKLPTPSAFATLAQSRIDRPEASYLGFVVLADQAHPDQNDLLLGADLRTFPDRGYYDKPEVIKDFEALVAESFREIGMDQPEQRAQWVIEFEKALAAVFPSPSEYRQRIAADTYWDRARWTVAYPSLQLGRFLARIPPTTRIRNPAPESLDFFEKALTRYPLEQLKSVLIFHAVKQYMDDAYPVFKKKAFAFEHQYLGGPEKRPDRQERCTGEVMARFPMELDQELLPILFPAFSQLRVTALADKIRSAILRGLAQNTWLSSEAKEEALKKITKAQLYLVKPQKENQWNFNPIKKYSPSHPYENRDRWKIAKIVKDLHELPLPRPRDRWEMGPLTLNAYYNPTDNKFVMLQGILQYPFYDPHLSETENLGAIGAIMGHELGHSIDDNGAKYDAEGRLRSWMSSEDLKTFKEKTARFVGRFNRLGHNGELTLGENIGDSVGLSFAYAAANPPSSEDQRRFFLAYARLWCRNIRPEFEQYLLKVDPHAMGKARVNEQVLHQPGFYQAYGCKKGDSMYLPEAERIRVW